MCGEVIAFAVDEFHANQIINRLNVMNDFEKKLDFSTMIPKYLNDLKVHMLYMNESPELADQKTQEYIDKFNKLDKYDHMEVYHIWEIDGFEKSLELIDKYTT